MFIKYKTSFHTNFVYKWIYLLLCMKCISGCSSEDLNHPEVSFISNPHSFNSARPGARSSLPNHLGEIDKLAIDGKIEGNASIKANNYVSFMDGLSEPKILKNGQPCVSMPENGRQLWVGSQTATLQWNYGCNVSRCSVECKNGIPDGSFYEKWSCKPNPNGFLDVNGFGLIRNRNYRCRVFATVGNLVIPGLDEVSFLTRDGRPFRPGVVWFLNITSTSFMVLWDPPVHADLEPVEYYSLQVYKEVPSYPLNTACGLPFGESLIFNTTKPSKLVTGLLPYYRHRVLVYACNKYGNAITMTEVITNAAEPGRCENATLVHTETFPDDQPTITVTWTEPCYWNGLPLDTYLTVSGTRPDNPKRHISQTHFFPAHHKISMEPSYENTFTFDASMDFNYTIELYVRLAEKTVPAIRRSDVWTVYIPPGLASVTNQWKLVRPEFQMSTGEATLHLHYGLLNDTNGTIKHVALMVAEKGYEGERQRQYLALPNWPKERDWYAATEGEHVLLYQATPKFFGISSMEDNATYPLLLGNGICLPRHTTVPMKSEEVTEPTLKDESKILRHRRGERYRRGEHDAHVSESLTTVPPHDEDLYCNGPLRRNIDYVVRLRVFTKAGYTDSKEIYFLTGEHTNDSKSSYIQLCYYAAFPTVLAAAVLVLLWIRKSRRGSNAIASTPSPGHKQCSIKTKRLRKNSRRRSISPDKLPKIAARFLSQRASLVKEFEDLNEISAAWAAKVSCSVGRLPENRLKNRYADVVPYDYNRVKLSSESTSHTDYINASFIQGFSLNVEYIACQGPTMETSNDFWQMVFDQNISLVVMLTSLVENGTAKCFQYFSELSESKEWMDFTVKCTSRVDLTNYTIRELELYKKTTLQKRLIKHFQFRDWPDFGCPRDIEGILEFCDVIRANCCHTSYSPTIVHCSAGIGRTGTLIALDILLQYVRYNRKVDVMRTVLRLREQRQWMVRTVEQYAFLYRCLKIAAERQFS